MSPLHMCEMPACTLPRYIDKQGREYRKCKMHMDEIHRRAAARRKAANAHDTTQPIGTTLDIIVVDYATDLLLRVRGEVVAAEAMPITERDLKDRLARAASQGVRISNPHPFKREDMT